MNALATSCKRNLEGDCEAEGPVARMRCLHCLPVHSPCGYLPPVVVFCTIWRALEKRGHWTYFVTRTPAQGPD